MKEYAFAVWQEGQKVATAFSQERNYSLMTAMHYARMYEPDGPVLVKEGNRIIYRTGQEFTQPAEAPNDD